MLKINEIELDFNLFDYKTALKYEEALKAVESRKPVGAGSLAEVIKDQCEAVFGFFDHVFGEGTADKVFGGRMNFEECLAAFKDVLADADRQKELTRKFLPNRAARRAK